MSCRAFAISLVVAVSALVGSARGTIIQPTEALSDDTFVYQFLSTFNFHGGPPFNGLLTAGNTVGTATPGHDTESLIRFDQSLIPTPLGFNTAADLRFTTKGATLYALGLAWPHDGKVSIKTLYAGTPYLSHAVASVTLLGNSGAAVHWEQTASGLEIHLPAAHDDLPYALRIDTHH